MVCARISNLLRRIAKFLVFSCSAAVVLSANSAAALPGSGTQQDPWRIESLADFDEFASDPNYWAGFTRLETDVNLAGRTYTTAIIAPDVNNADSWFDGTPFTGVFDGNDHKITNMTINGGVNEYLGLFACIGDGQVNNLGLEGGSVNGHYSIGGLVGKNGDWDHPGSAITNCYSIGSISGNDSVGGLVGTNFGHASSISNCYSIGSINGNDSVGGLVGENGGSISNCYSTGSVTGEEEVGGLLGANGDRYNLEGAITNCYSSGDVSGRYGVGGLVGSNPGTVSNCYSIGDVSGVGYVGGLGGYNGNGPVWTSVPGDIFNSYSAGDVNGVYFIGGLLGLNYGSISNCYSTGDVNGVNAAGGLVGQNGQWLMQNTEPGCIYNSYSTGDVNGGHVGGLVAANFVGDIGASFWDVETSGEPNMCVSQNEYYATGCDPNCGKTTAEMKTKSTFTDAGWDFVDIWLINEGATYPVLRQEIRSDLNGTGGIDLLDFAVFADHWLEGKGD